MLESAIKELIRIVIIVVTVYVMTNKKQKKGLVLKLKEVGASNTDLLNFW